MRKRNPVAMFCVLAIAATACTLSADDAGQLLGDEAVHIYALNNIEQEEIQCTLQLDTPHQSRHKPENANVVGRINCDAVVPRIDMRITLARDGIPVGEGHKDKGNRKSLKANAAAPCIAGIYRGSSTTKIYFPRGYRPNPQEITAYSAEEHLPCTRRADNGEVP